MPISYQINYDTLVKALNNHGNLLPLVIQAIDKYLDGLEGSYFRKKGEARANNLYTRLNRGKLNNALIILRISETLCKKNEGNENLDSLKTVILTEILHNLKLNNCIRLENSEGEKAYVVFLQLYQEFSKIFEKSVDQQNSETPICLAKNLYSNFLVCRNPQDEEEIKREAEEPLKLPEAQSLLKNYSIIFRKSMMLILQAGPIDNLEYIVKLLYFKEAINKLCREDREAIEDYYFEMKIYAYLHQHLKDDEKKYFMSYATLNPKFENHNLYMLWMRPHEKAMNTKCNLADIISFIRNGNENFYELALAIIYDIFKSIQILHKYGILHRDIKPENFVIGINTTNWTLQVFPIDFGYAITKGNDMNEMCSCGTYGYIDPNFELDPPIHAKQQHIDYYSLGMVLINLFFEIKIPMWRLRLKMLGEVNKQDEMPDNDRDSTYKCLLVDDYLIEYKLSKFFVEKEKKAKELIGIMHGLTSFAIGSRPTINDVLQSKLFTDFDRNKFIITKKIREALMIQIESTQKPQELDESSSQDKQWARLLKGIKF